jgi:exopolysaccharide production protein ExoY
MTAHYPDLADESDSVQIPVLDRQSLERRGVYRKFLKRVFDLLAVLVSLPITLPMLAVMAFLISLDGHSPVYTQHRVGRGGRIFRLWKLRSMVIDADARLEAYLTAHPAARAEWNLTQKLRDDPRITRIGYILRKSSMDELPQILNVLRGDMSLVGPRPMMPSQAKLYPGTSYYALRPGITGSWQVSARNDSSFADRARFDADYDQRLSLLTDLVILFATVRVVLRGTGH